MSDLPGSTFIHFDGTVLTVSANTIPEKKLALKEVKLKKKEWVLRKRSITDHQKLIRTTYTHKIRSRGSVGRGGGRVGQIRRNFDHAWHDMQRAQLAHDLAPLEQQKQQVETIILAYDNLALQLEQQILNSAV